MPERLNALSPTDLSQFVRLGQCRRYLRLRLRERAEGRGFLREAGVEAQAIPPLHTRSGREFEAAVEQAAASRLRTLHLAREAGEEGDRGPDNARIVAEAQALPPGEAVLLFQARLRVEVDGWLLTGDADALRLERSLQGGLRVMIADMKSTTAARVEHRLQVAFYHAMLAGLLAAEGVPVAGIETAILYRGPNAELDPAEDAAQRAEALRLFGADALLERVTDPEAYLESVRDLVTGPESVARQVADAPFESLPFHLEAKCDGCLYNAYCLKWAAEHDDLSLIPHLTPGEKSALHRCGVRTTKELAGLKVLGDPPPTPSLQGGGSASTLPTSGTVDSPFLEEGGVPACGSRGVGPPPTPNTQHLTPTPGREPLCRRIAVTWPVGPRLDELVHRALRFREAQGDPVRALREIPGSRHGSLPYTDAEHNPNLVRIFLDAQHDSLHGRLYLLGAWVVACAGGEPVRRRAVVELTEGPPESDEVERDLLLRWIAGTLQAVLDLAEPDANGERNAPIHLVFFNAAEQRLFLEGLSRHLTTLLGTAPALYDFLTQLAAYDSPLATFLDQEMRELKNYPLLCQSLQAVARLLGFDWDQPEPFSRIFRERLFDATGKREEAGAEVWYTARARFSSRLPLEYAYAAWGQLPPPPARGRDELAPYRRATIPLLRRFQQRRLEAMEHVAADFSGNRLTQKRPFKLPDLAAFSDCARSLAQALDEFVSLERHVELGAWKRTRHAPPERRVLMGETLLARYREADQEPAVVERLRANERARALEAAYREAYRQSNPQAKQVRLTAEQKAECRFEQAGIRVRLRLETEGIDCSLDEALALCALKDGGRVVLNRRWTVDGRLPPEAQAPFTPTPKQMLYGERLDLARLVVERDADGRALAAWAEVELLDTGHFHDSRGFVFGQFHFPLEDAQLYTLDPCPNSIYGYWCAKVTEGLRELEAGRAAGRNTLYERLARPPGPSPAWDADAAAGQARFLAGLDAFYAAGLLHGFEESKREYVGRHGEAPILLVQGPPGTGKSYSTAFALFARMQGAFAAGQPFRAFVSCKTHAATDVLLENVRAVQERLRQLRGIAPDLFDRHFDARILEAPLFRVAGRAAPPDGIVPLAKEGPAGAPKAVDAIRGEPYCIAGATPGGIYGLVRGAKSLFTTHFCDCLVLDEASQMNLPEACMAALPLRPEGQLIVVGDPRQMPPIIQHDWDREPRRSFREYRAYESLFLALAALEPPTIRFAESFRLHAAMAEFLRREVYALDGIPYFSRRTTLLPPRDHTDDFLRAVLAPEHPLVVVLHDEAESQNRNPFEEALVRPLLEALADPERYGLDPDEGLGVVVPHRAQRAALQLGVPCLSRIDPETGRTARSAVDTVERFQGGERRVILVSATESDPEYLLASSQFLLDPRRLTVALSRAKEKLVLVAARSIFALFSPDEETFAHARLWKNLLRRTCTTLLWSGEVAGERVEVYGCAGERVRG